MRARVTDALDTNEVRWATEMATWLARSADAEQTDRDLLARCLRTIAERTPAANIRSWALTRARHLDGTSSMNRYVGHRFQPGMLARTPTASIVAMLRVIVDPELVEGIDHHVAFVVDDTECGLHVRNAVAVPTDGRDAASTVRTSRETLLAVLSGRSTWSDAERAGSIVVSGDHAMVDRIRQSFDNAGVRS